MQIQSNTIQKLKTFEHILQNGYQSIFIDNVLNKLVSIEKDKSIKELKEVNERIKQFEINYGISSGEFYEKFYSGHTGDSVDEIEWISFIDMRSAIQKRINILK